MAIGNNILNIMALKKCELAGSELGWTAGVTADIPPEGPTG